VAAPGVLDITQGRDADRPPHPRLDDALAALAAQPAGERAADAPTTDGLTMQDGRVQARLVVAADGQDAARAAVVAAGGEVTGALDGALQVWLPPATLTAVADSPGVAYLGAPDYAQLAAADAVSEGVARAEATAWHAAGLRGQGVRIAIIDGGFQGYTAKLGSELPANVVVKNFVDGQPDAEVDATTPHGTACAEIVHDMAPSAQLYLIKIATDVDLDQAVSYAIAQGVDVISTSLTFLNITPGDGTGRFAAMADRARAAGILWTTAAGNYRETHWSGTSTDGDNDNLHEYAPGVEVNVFGPGNGSAYQIPAGVVLSPALRWDDWTEVRQDFRLLLLRYNGATFDIVASANNPQTGLPGQRPTERLNYITTGGAAIYGVAIQRISGARPVFLNLLTPNRELDRRVPAMSLGDLADVPGVLTVGAVDHQYALPGSRLQLRRADHRPGRRGRRRAAQARHRRLRRRQHGQLRHARLQRHLGGHAPRGRRGGAGQQPLPDVRAGRHSLPPGGDGCRSGAGLRRHALRLRTAAAATATPAGRRPPVLAVCESERATLLENGWIAGALAGNLMGRRLEAGDPSYGCWPCSSCPSPTG
jgi:hypothetical protein